MQEQGTARQGSAAFICLTVPSPVSRLHHVELVVIKGAGHANIFLNYAGAVVDAAIKGKLN
jgi:hypothetical protein